MEPVTTPDVAPPREVVTTLLYAAGALPDAGKYRGVSPTGEARRIHPEPMKAELV